MTIVHACGITFNFLGGIKRSRSADHEQEEECSGMLIVNLSLVVHTSRNSQAGDVVIFK